MSRAAAPPDVHHAARGGSSSAAAEQRRTTGDGKPSKGSPLLLVLLFAVLLPAVLISTALGAGPAAMVGGMVALFSLVAFLGGPLRTDLRLAAALAPLLFIGAVVPRVLLPVSPAASVAVAVLVVFVASLLPLWGSRLTTAGTGLGMSTLFAYGFAPQGDGPAPVQLVVAVATALALALLLRVLLGLSDPSKPTREAAANLLDGDHPDPVTAFDLWFSDGRQRWLARVLGAATQYRLALRTLTREDPHDAGLAPLQERAHALAERVRAKSPEQPGDDDAVPDHHTAADPARGGLRDTDGARPAAVQRAGESRGVSEPGEVVRDAGNGPCDVVPALTAASAALDAVEQASADRDRTPVTVNSEHRNLLRELLGGPSARLRSVQLRHALRTALAVLLMLLVVLTLNPNDPMRATGLMTVFGILQASWRDTVAKAAPRIGALLLGSAGVALTLLLVPPRYLIWVALAALCAGMWNLLARPAVGNAFMVLMSVGLNASTRHLDPVALLQEYVVLVLLSVGIGLGVGFVVVPAMRPVPLARRIHRAVAATDAYLARQGLLGAVGTTGSARSAVSGPSEISETPAASAGAVDSVGDDDVAALRADARNARNDLVPDKDTLTDTQLAQLSRLRAALRDLCLIAAVSGAGQRDETAGHMMRSLSDEARTLQTELLDSLPPVRGRHRA